MNKFYNLENLAMWNIFSTLYELSVRIILNYLALCVVFQRGAIHIYAYATVAYIPAYFNYPIASGYVGPQGGGYLYFFLGT